MSRGIRIYFHRGRLRLRWAYNLGQGMRELREWMKSCECESVAWELIGFGSEEGAMVAHFRWMVD